jgi:hypothetical protein
MKNNGKHETSRAWIRASKRDNAIAAIFAGLDSAPKQGAAIQHMNKQTSDLTYKQTGLFVRFYPETHAGGVAWAEMASIGDAGVIYACHLDSTLKQLRDAGYRVTKAKPIAAKIDDDALLAELFG